MLNKTKKTNKTLFAYGMIFLVVFIWGCSPPLNNYLNQNYSAALRTAIVGLISSIALFFLCLNRLSKLNLEYFKLAIPTGICVALASVVQKIGLYYTTPTKYAFLENLSCVVVPVILFFVIKKKPSFLTIFSSILCLVGCFVLSGINFSSGDMTFGIGELLCALAGVLYGVNIAYTGSKIHKFDTLLYLFVQIAVQAIAGIIFAYIFSIIKINGSPIEVFKWSWDILGISLIIIVALVSNVLCWFLRTYAMNFVNPTAVSVIMPFSAVVTGIVSVIFGMDTLSLEFIFGGIISLGAVILSSIADIKYEHKDNKSN
jgi:drug/metabolite transporter (DMT)-like permease